MLLVALALPASAGQRAAVETRVAASSVLKLAALGGDVATAQLDNLLVNPPAQFDAGQRYVLQLTGPLTIAARDALASIGVELGSYLPEHAYIVDLANVSPAALAARPEVAWVGTYQKAWKVSPRIGVREDNLPYAMPDRQEKAARGEVVVDITVFAGMDADAAAAQVQQLGGQIHRIEPAGRETEITATIALASVPALADIPEIQWVEEAPDVSLRNATVRWIAQSNISGSTPIHDEGIRGAGQVVGILDGKIDKDHCSFSDTNPIGPTHRKILAYNTSFGADLHGTHVAGTAVGDSGADNDRRGMAYEGKLVYNTIPSFTNSGVYNALQLHHDQGARVHTNSWGNDGTTAYDGLARGIDRFMYDNEESLAVWAVTNTSTLKNPENAKNLLAVGATEDTPSQAFHCTGGTGPTSDGRRKPEVYLPGCGINSADAGTSCGITSLSGTSMASPAVAGTAMLVRQYYMDGFYPSGSANALDAFTPSAALVKATLINCSVDMTGVSGYPSNTEGWGRIKLDRALYFAGESRHLIVADTFNAAGLTTGDMDEMTFDVNGSLNLYVTLAWTEPAASAGSGSPSINNLDLEVVDPMGTTYLGNVFSGGFSTTGGSADTVNNVEQVHISSPTTGTWTVRVKGTAVNQPSQGYGLVLSGNISAGAADPCPTDFNGDGSIDITDLGTLLANFGTASGATKADGDANGDGAVDITDLGLVLADFGSTCP